MAIASGDLEVEIDGEEFTGDNIKEKLDIYYPKEEYSEFDSIRNRNPEFVFNPRPYCNEVFLKQIKMEITFVLILRTSLVNLPNLVMQSYTYGRVKV